MSSRIVTHGGGPHMDDLISVCIVLAMDNNIKCVERRPVKPEEIADPTVWVLDQGGVHDLESRRCKLEKNRWSLIFQNDK